MMNVPTLNASQWRPILVELTDCALPAITWAHYCVEISQVFWMDIRTSRMSINSNDKND